ncbi:protein mono-ADP-ribosyltransferase PARP14-like isoform X2 [Engystomops pustulosus]|uniref:protein mono-ADP-ribosyltransferase PARP14-like isoform X2 n=1 Tax=Engystomops pustulosus TaxID=76066 RepID=UPI003AFB0239
MGDLYQFPLILSWNQGPEKLKQVKNKLLKYFQSKKSHGGECQIQDMDCSRGYILLHFRDKGVRDRVLQAGSHVLEIPGGRTLQLDVSDVSAQGGATTQEASGTPRREDPLRSPGKSSVPVITGGAKVSKYEPGGQVEQLRSNMVLIKNVQDAHKLDMMTLLIENVSNRNGETDFYLERIPEIQAAVVTFTCDIDIFGFCEKFSKNRRAIEWKQTANPLEETRSLRAEELPPKTGEDYITLYFESSKLGGYKVEDAVMIPEEEAAVITFSDPQIVKVLLQKEHIIEKKAISVYPYYPTLDIVLYGKKRPCVERPQPIQKPISPYILHFIWKDARLRESIEKSMSDKKCEIIWPDLSCSNPIITLKFPDCLSAQHRTMAMVARTWTDTVSTEFSLIISRYKVIDCKMNPSAWEDIKAQTSTDAYHGVLVSPNTDSDKVFLAGAIKDVNKIEQNFRKMVEEVTQKAERKSQVTTMKVPMSAALYHILCNSGLKKQILAEVPELKMEYDTSTHNVTLTGLQNEALLAKCEILNVQQKLKSKFVQSSPHVLQFLMSSDNDEVSCLLLVRHNINALIEVEENAIKLTGYTKKDLVDAEEQIRKEVISKQIPVDDKNILRGPEWKSLQSHLLESLNSETSTVIIEEAENHVVVTGLAASVHKSFKEIHEFVEKNTPMQKNIQVRSMAVMQFIQEKNSLDELKQINVRVALRSRNIHLSGTKTYVEEATSHVQKVLSSIFWDTLLIDKPGAKKHYLANEKMYITCAKNNYNCVIHLQKEEDDEDLPKDDADPGESLYQVSLPQGVTISVYRGNLCRHNADAIVNAANKDLKHIGGLAQALLLAAGPKLQDDCEQLVRRQGSLYPGESVITDAGNLPCKQVIHTVGPKWNSNSAPRCKDLLQKAIISSLALAAEHGHRCIAIPAISSGIFGFPIQTCAQTIIEAIKEFVEGKGRSSSVTRIDLVDNKDETITAFTKSLKEQFGDQTLAKYTVKRANEITPERRGKGEMPPTSRQGEMPPTSRQGEMPPTSRQGEMPPPRLQGAATGQTIVTQNIVIGVKEGLLQDTTTDVIVNSVGKDLDLSSGGASRALHEKAGPQLQGLLAKEATGASVADGSMFVTAGGNLSCNIVIHVIVPSWDRGKGSSEKILRKIIQSCMDKAEKRQLTSITFPAIGTGLLGFPKSFVASVMFDEVLRFSSSSGNQFLQQVTFMLHPNDRETIQEFSKELNERKRRHPAAGDQTIKPVPKAKPKALASSAFFGAVKNLNLGIHEMRVGSMTYQVKTGDITKEDTDIIVNSTDQNFNLRSGVSKAILEAAGPAVQDECTKLASQNKKSSHIVTQSGNLLCKQILHVHGKNSEDGVRDFIVGSLQECARLQASSVAFPAIGTGLGSLASALVADIILDAVTEFARSQSSSGLQTVKVVIFQQQMLQDFYASMKKKEGTDLPKQTSLLSKINSFFSYFTSKPNEETEPKVFELRENIEPAVFHLCAGTRNDVRDASSWLQDLILREQHQNLITDDWILEFDEKDHHILSQDQRKLGVSVSFQAPGSTVKISGLTRDVLEMTNIIQDMIKKVREKKTREREAELCSNLVEWRYHDGTRTVAFDRMINLDLEKAKDKTIPTLDIEVQGVTYTVVLELKSMRDPKGNEMKIERVSKHGQSELPSRWTPMSGSQVMAVPVSPGGQEYQEVEAEFRKSCQMKIVKIERIQNKDLWLNYQIKKQATDTKNRTTNNERRLFHGTDSSTIKTVNNNGFNRSYAGKNAACYGNGTYFAVNSNYSAHDQYSKPDANGLKYMYLARVLTGVFCKGQQGMVAPPAKNAANITDLYDSVTDNPANPSMFVIFHDIQAYPEYLITFSK